MATFAGKVAFVTGAASDMGRATAGKLKLFGLFDRKARLNDQTELLARRGAAVALVDRRREEVQTAAKEVKSRHGVETIGLTVDVSDWPQVEQAVKDTASRLGRLDCAFNAAGLPGLEGKGYLLADYPPE